MSKGVVMLVASFPESILTFRGPLIMSILSAGHPVHVAAPSLSKGTPIRSSLESLGVTVHDIPLARTGTNPSADLKLALHLYQLLRDVRPVVVLGYTVKPVIYGTLAGWMARIPRRYALVTGLGYAFTGSRKGMLTGLVRQLYRLALARADKVFFQNPDDRNLLRESGILSAEKPTVVVNGSGVDVSAFEATSIPAGESVFLMIGRLLGDKGVREYAEAAARVRALHPEVRFGLVGWIDENPDAIAQSELDVWVADGTIEFLGKLDDVRPAIEACTVYVLPSYREGTPRTVLEAMAMGRPIITTDAPGCRETVIDGDNGFLVPVQSVDALVEAMLKFIDDPGLAQRMGRRSRQIAEDKYDVHKVNAVMLREMGITPTPGTPGKVA
ncbi:glycosyltransferase family 4 protein [Luteimonas dalianensis]|uniref:glycosyltransferase family 4 protein n=1 Tax=Luteimonas dalianensis TaxID=1148196 RepID=UPI003BF1EC66